MTYNVFGGTLNFAQLQLCCLPPDSVVTKKLAMCELLFNKTYAEMLWICIL